MDGIVNGPASWRRLPRYSVHLAFMAAPQYNGYGFFHASGYGAIFQTLVCRIPLSSGRHGLAVIPFSSLFSYLFGEGWETCFAVLKNS